MAPSVTLTQQQSGSPHVVRAPRWPTGPTSGNRHLPYYSRAVGSCTQSPKLLVQGALTLRARLHMRNYSKAPSAPKAVGCRSVSGYGTIATSSKFRARTQTIPSTDSAARRHTTVSASAVTSASSANPWNRAYAMQPWTVEIHINPPKILLLYFFRSSRPPSQRFRFVRSFQKKKEKESRQFSHTLPSRQ